jgi:hypothetical protein
MIKNNNYLDSLSKNLIDDVRSVMENKGCKKDCKCDKCSCDKEEKGEVKEAKKMKGEDPCWKDYKMVGTKKGKGGKEVPNCVPEEVEVKNEAYNKDAVDNAISSSNRSGRKIGSKEGKMIHALLKGRTPKSKDDVKEEVEEVNEISKKLATDYFHAKQDKARKDFMRGRPTNKKGVMLAKDKIEGRAKVPATNEEVELDEISSDLATRYVEKSAPDRGFGDEQKARLSQTKRDNRQRYGNVAREKIFAGKNKDKETSVRVAATNEEFEIDEAKKENPITGTRLVSKHEGQGGHHAEVRYNHGYDEYQVHHYENGKHMGEGPVSYHGSGKEGKEDATETAEYEVKNYRPKNGKLQLHKEETSLDEKLIGKQHKLDKNKNGKLDKQDFKMLRKEEASLDEKLNPSMGASKYVQDFVKSKDPRFEGKTKKERIKMALGAYYGAKNEAVEVDQIDEITSGLASNYLAKAASNRANDSAHKNLPMKKRDNRMAGANLAREKIRAGENKDSMARVGTNEEVQNFDEGYGDKRDYKKHHISVNGKYVATTTWAKSAKEAERKFIEQHPEHKNAKITVVKER